MNVQALSPQPFRMLSLSHSLALSRTLSHSLALSRSLARSLARARVLSGVLSLNDGASLADQHSERIRNLEASQHNSHNGFET
jgi:hypothetical protein